MFVDTAVQTDLTFFTNEPGHTLLDRFRATLKYAHLLDVIVGYFRVSGFHELHEALVGVERVRVLVGLTLDRTSYDLIEAYRGQASFDFASHAKAKETVRRRVVSEMEAAEDGARVERGLRAFLEMLETGRLEIKAYPTADLHAKVYVVRNDPERSPDFGRVITGSSNFSAHGLVAQREFNVELKDRADVDYALAKFEALWAEAVPVTEDYVDALRRQTWLDDSITPYELYLKFLYEYFREEINRDKEADETYLPDGFMELGYQSEAVGTAWGMLEAYGGVFIADVVGLGKTYIAAMLAQKVLRRRAGERVLVVCPPVLQAYWRETFRDFRIGDWHYEVESLGKLDALLARGTDEFGTVILDEAHRFRNEETQSYEALHQICLGKRVVLVSATPLNNAVADIFSLLKLFQAPKKSTIPGVPDLESLFREKQRELAKLDRRTPEYVDAVKRVAGEIRDRVLKHVMVRRTRGDIRTYYAKDLEQQGLAFPTLAAPRRIVYKLEGGTEDVFERTVERLTDFSYARYTPLLYLKKPLSPLEAQSQRNVGGFMKGLLVKRLESSFFAFRQTVGRAVRSYERFLKMLDAGTVYTSRGVNVYDLIDGDREDELERLIELERVQKYASTDFTERYGDQLRQDLAILRAVQADWETVEHDPKLAAFLDALRRDPALKGQRVLVFTESKETSDYLFDALDGVLPGQVMAYSSEGGRIGEQALNVAAARATVTANFDPNTRKKGAVTRDDTLRVLVTTDVLAEGINLHRANVVVNYDLPWNPTRVLQRVGRVNRVGTEHETVFVYNFFPTDQSEAQLGLEAAVKAKIQAFHDMLGEDAKYLTDEEEVDTYGLFGERLYERLNDGSTYEGDDDDGPSELGYLQEIRTVRDTDPSLFARVRSLPKRARLSRPESSARGETDELLTFFRRDKLKKFFLARDGAAAADELTFLDAAERFRAAPEEPGRAAPAAYYTLIERSKESLDLLLAGAAPAAPVRTGRSNDQYILRRLKAKEIRRCPTLTDDDEALVTKAIRAFTDGAVAKGTAKKLKNAIEREADPLRVVALVRDHVPQRVLDDDRGESVAIAPKEVVLSEHFPAGPQA